MEKKKISSVNLKLKLHPSLLGYRSFSEKAADILTSYMGSWIFLFIFILFLTFWILFNVYSWINNWDPYPFILLNLFLSMLAAIQAPIILMSQNREAKKDRARLQYDYAVNRKAEREIEQIKKQLDRIERKI